MDRLFLSGLVREIAPAVCGCRVRSVRIDPDGGALYLALSGSRARQELVLHVRPGTAGLFTRELPRVPGSLSPREANLGKLLVSSEIVSAETSELDRVVTIELEQTRLSGKKRRRALVFELVAARNSLFVVDADSSRVVDVVTTGSSRLAVGDRYRPLDPPPHASVPARDSEELEHRIGVSGSTIDHRSLLSATGWTPLLVTELLFLMESDNGVSLSIAFDTVQSGLQAKRPGLYVDRDQRHKVLLSPVTLASKSRLEPLPVESFNAAMAEAVRITVNAERSSGARQRLGAGVSRRLKSLRTLTRKLEEQRRKLPEPGALRRKGETLLAGIGQAKRVGGASVRVPDPFHPEGRPIEIEIDPRMSIADNAERLFRRSRKAERTEIELRRRLDELQQQTLYAEGVGVSLDDAVGLDELEAIEREMEEQGLAAVRDKRARKGSREDPKRPTRRAGLATRLPPRSFRTHRGNVILVGRSARSNADLTFRLAKPGDLWLHASGIPGSHVVLKLSGAVEVDEQEIAEAAGYAAHFSKARHDLHVDVMVTERRNVSKIKGAPPGLVRVERARTVRVRPTPPESD